jgi:hypothetical protein
MRCLVTAGNHMNITRAFSRQLLVKQVPAEMNTHATIEELLIDGVFCWVRLGAI